MDDEKYFTFSGHKIPGNAGYYSSDKSKCPDKVRFAGKEKYPTKVLIWIAISARGISKPLIRPSKSEAINSDIYINECLAKGYSHSSTSIIQTPTTFSGPIMKKLIFIKK